MEIVDVILGSVPLFSVFTTFCWMLKSSWRLTFQEGWLVGDGKKSTRVIPDFASSGYGYMISYTIHRSIFSYYVSPLLPFEVVTDSIMPRSMLVTPKVSLGYNQSNL
jgi:hypothetical protein